MFIIIDRIFSSRQTSLVLVSRILFYEAVRSIKPELSGLAKVGNSLRPVVGSYSCQAPVVVCLGEVRIQLNGSGIVINGLGIVLARGV